MTGEVLQPGDVVADTYRIERLIGSGGFAQVYRARQIELERRVALKVLTPETGTGLSPPENVRKRFYREARLMSRLQAPHTVNVFEYDMLESGELFMALEYIDGVDLDTFLDSTGALEPGRMAGILAQIVKALGAAHDQGVLHRDIKPTNVMIFERFGETDCVKLLDFGVAKSVLIEGKMQDDLTREGAVIGTPRYMSPEQLLGQPLTAASDLFGAGLLMYEMYVGRSPFETNDLNAIYSRMQRFSEDLGPLESAPSPLDEVAAKLLHPSLDERYAEAANVLADLQGDESAEFEDASEDSSEDGADRRPISVRDSTASGPQPEVSTQSALSFPLGLDRQAGTPSSEMTDISQNYETTVAMTPPGPSFETPDGDGETRQGIGPPIVEPTPLSDPSSAKSEEAPRRDGAVAPTPDADRDSEPSEDGDSGPSEAPDDEAPESGRNEVPSGPTAEITSTVDGEPSVEPDRPDGESRSVWIGWIGGVVAVAALGLAWWTVSQGDSPSESEPAAEPRVEEAYAVARRRTRQALAVARTAAQKAAGAESGDRGEEDSEAPSPEPSESESGGSRSPDPAPSHREGSTGSEPTPAETDEEPRPTPEQREQDSPESSGPSETERPDRSDKREEAGDESDTSESDESKPEFPVEPLE